MGLFCPPADRGVSPVEQGTSSQLSAGEGKFRTFHGEIRETYPDTIVEKVVLGPTFWTEDISGHGVAWFVGGR